jgi:hypothetical protein
VTAAAELAYSRASAVLEQLRPLAMRAVLDDNSTALGTAVGHIAARHPETLGYLLLLAMIDVGVLSETVVKMAEEIAQATGEPVPDVMGRHVRRD